MFSRLTGTRRNIQSTFMQFSSTLIDFELVQILMRVDKTFRYRAVISSQLSSSLVLVWPGHESWENSHVNSRFSTLMQPLFSFDRDMRVEKTLTQTLASQLSSTLMPLLFSFDRGHKSWENSHANSRFSTLMQLLFSFDRGMRVEKTHTQTLASQLSSTLMQLLFSFDRVMRVEKTLAWQTVIFASPGLKDSATHFIVWPMWKSCHGNRLLLHIQPFVRRELRPRHLSHRVSHSCDMSLGENGPNKSVVSLSYWNKCRSVWCGPCY
jgi:hypothetical protein